MCRCWIVWSSGAMGYDFTSRIAPQSMTATHTFSSVEYWTTPSTSNSSLYKVRHAPSRSTICCWAKSSTVPMQFKRRRPCASALWKSANTRGCVMHCLLGLGFSGWVGDRGRKQTTRLVWRESGDGRMMRTTARGVYHITSHLTDCPDGGETNLSMRNCRCDLCDGQANRTLDRHAGDTTWVGACPPENV